MTGEHVRPEQEGDPSVDRDEMEAILLRESLGYLGLSHEGRPYVVPLNYAYADGRIIFHCAFDGQKIDYLRANPRVCFAVGRQTGTISDHGDGTSCHVDNDSVLCFGTARILDDFDERYQALDLFNRRYHPEAHGLSRNRVANCAAVEIRVEEMTGRHERDRTHIHWRHEFPAKS